MGKKFSLLAAATLVLTASAANAQTFATFTVGNAPVTEPFQFINTGATSTFGLYGTNTPLPASFFYQTASSYGLVPTFDPIDALMTFTAEVDGLATSTQIFPGVFFASQKLKNINITFTAVTPYLGMDNLLTVTLSQGTLGGIIGGQALGIQATEPPDTINYASDFLDFSGPFNSKDYSISLTNATPAVAIDGNGYMRSFKSSASGLFASDPVPPSKIPEPGTMALLAIGAIAGIAVRRRK